MSTNTAAANAVANNAANAVKLVQAFEDAGVTLTDSASGSEITAQKGGRRNTRRNRNRKNRRNNMTANRKNRRNNMSRRNRKNRKNSRRNRKNSRRNRK